MNVQSSASLKRLNHLQCEMSVVYHEMSHLCGLSDSTMQILYTICNFDEESCLLRDICRLIEYSRAAEPPVQYGVSHLSIRTEPHCL